MKLGLRNVILHWILGYTDIRFILEVIQSNFFSFT